MKRPRLSKTINRPMLAVLGLIIAAAAFGSAYFMARHDRSKPAARAAVCDQNVACINLDTDRADPDAVAVPVGGYAQINSADGKTHKIGLGEGDAHHDGSHEHSGPYSSGDFKADEAWKVQFKQAGTFEFHDHYNPELHFTVIVYQPGADYRIKN